MPPIEALRALRTNRWKVLGRTLDGNRPVIRLRLKSRGVVGQADRSRHHRGSGRGALGPPRSNLQGDRGSS